MTVTQRLSINEVAPDAYRAVMPLQKFAVGGTVERELLLLVQIRASQLNHCAWCLDMHAREAREAGIPQRKLDLIAAWREAGALFDARQQAVLAFAEEVTLIGEHGVSDEVWAALNAEFDQQQVVQLLMAAAVINVWNRMNVAVLTDLPAAE